MKKSRVEGYELVPAINECKGCAFDESETYCQILEMKIFCCNDYKSIYQPTQTNDQMQRPELSTIQEE